MAEAPRLRPMTGADLEAVDGCAHRAFDALYTPLGFPAGERDAARVAAALARLRRLCATDPDGCWVAERDGEVAGAALALRRGDFWGLSLLVVAPDHQTAGIGRGLLTASLRTAEGARGMILASADPRAVRLYTLAGFDLHPAMRTFGSVRRATLPATPSVREGGADDLGHTEAVDRAVRGVPHGDDLRVPLDAGARLFVTQGAYALLHRDSVSLLAATTPDAAETVLWRCLAEAPGEVNVPFLTAGNQWAMRVALAAGLRLEPAAPVFVRGMQPPRGYVPSGAWL